MSRSELLARAFDPRVTTNKEANMVSGRGMGLSAARTAMRRVGGDVRMETSDDGTRLVANLPLGWCSAVATVFPSACGRVAFAVTEEWSTRPISDTGGACDPLLALDVRPQGGTPAPRVVEAVRGDCRRRILVGGDGRLRTVRRTCATHPSSPVEVGSVEGEGDLLLIRPEVLIA